MQTVTSRRWARRSVSTWTLGLCASLTVQGAAWAGWPTDPTVNVPLVQAMGIQEQPVSVSDGLGG